MRWCRSSPPRARFVLSPGARYLLVGDVPRCHPAQRLVRAQDLAGLQELDLTVYALEQVAGLRPQFTGLGPGELEHVRIDLHDPYSRLCVKPGLELDEQGTLQLLVPGPWILHARRADSALSVLLPPGVGARVDLRPALESPVWLIVD